MSDKEYIMDKVRMLEERMKNSIPLEEYKKLEVRIAELEKKLKEDDDDGDW